MKKNSVKFLIIIFSIVFVIYTIGFLIRFNFRTPYYMVFIVPNHGGKSAAATQTDGDWYNPVIKKYTMPYREGLYYNNISEFGRLLKLGFRITKLLEKTKHNSEWHEFENLLIENGVTNSYRKIILDPELIKIQSYKAYGKKSDVNKYFRIMDFPSHGLFGGTEKGIISEINKFKSEFILTVDMNYGNTTNREIFAVISPSYNFYNYIRKQLINNSFDFSKYSNIVNNYFGKDYNTKITNIINDTYLYFTGYLPDKSLTKPDLKKFIGLGYNMVTWDWNDGSSWYKEYKNKKEYPWYNFLLEKFIPGGNFWDKEKSIYEKWKREKSEFKEGDLYHAADNILNVIKSKFKSENIIVGKPKYKFDAFTLYTTALVINLNLGSIYDKNNILFKDKNITKLANAVGIGLYSICAGYKLKNKYYMKPINLIKYQKDKYIGRRKKRH